MKLIAQISKVIIDDGVKYLVIESDKNDSKGFFLFLHKSLDSPCEADLWFADIDGAKGQAALNYEIKPEDWQVIDV